MEDDFFVPGHITGLFTIQDGGGDILHQGSVGAGFSITRGVQTSVTLGDTDRADDQIFINGIQKDDAEVSRTVIALFRDQMKKINRTWDNPLIVRHSIEVPIGSGFGSSGAGALSLAYCLNRLSGAGLSPLTCAEIAHCAEVLNKTGLGTVAGVVARGFEIRLKPGAPGVGMVMNIPVEKPYIACFASFGPFSTKDALSDPKIRQTINRVGTVLLQRLIESPSVPNLMSFSREFAERIGLITAPVHEVLTALDLAGYVGSMHMFGNGVFSLVSKEAEEEVLGIFKRFADRATIFSAGIA